MMPVQYMVSVFSTVIKIAAAGERSLPLSHTLSRSLPHTCRRISLCSPTVKLLPSSKTMLLSAQSAQDKRGLAGKGGITAANHALVSLPPAGLAFLWVILHKVAGDGKETSNKRYKKALEWINAALTDADLLNLGTLVHGTSDVLAEPPQPESSSSSSSSEDEEEHAPVRPPPIRSMAERVAQQRGGTPAAVRSHESKQRN